MTAVRYVNDWTLKDVLGDPDTPVVVLFHAVGSPLDRGMRALFRVVAEDCMENVRFCAVDVGENPSLREQYNIRIQPTIVRFKAGRETDRRIRPSIPNDIQSLIAGRTGGPPP